jgi:hypothetical protein
MLRLQLSKADGSENAILACSSKTMRRSALQEIVGTGR